MTEYIKLRFTIGELDNARSFFRSVLPLEELDVCVFGFENKDKNGKPTHPHYHCHFAIDTEKHPKINVGSIRKKIQRIPNKNDYFNGNSGNAVYSLSQEKDVLEPHRFFRYPFKQGGRTFVNWEKLPEDFDIDMQIALAEEEYARMVEQNNKKLDKLLRPNTKDKLFEYLDECKITPQTEKVQILKLILIYYNREEMSANKQTIMGYLNTAMLRYKIQTEEEMAKEWLNNI